MRRLSKLVLVTSLLAAIVVTAAIAAIRVPDREALATPGTMVTVYKNETCDCCSAYIEQLEVHGYEVEVVVMEDVSGVKDEWGVPEGKRSCHTSVIGDYFVEGHVPLKAVKKLLDEQPDVAGITLPGMPIGAPGMPGIKTESLVVLAVTEEGDTTEFATY
jgi:hypothetical protein